MNETVECGWCGHARGNHGHTSGICQISGCQCYEWHEPGPKANLRSVMPHQEVYNKADVEALAALADNLLCNRATVVLNSTEMRLAQIDDALIARVLNPWR